MKRFPCITGVAMLTLTVYLVVRTFRGTYEYFAQVLPEIRQHFTLKVAERVDALKKLYNSSYEEMHKKGALYVIMVPEVHCPNKVRLGAVGDGGKWMCNPMAMRRDCAVFSLGVLNDISFEQDIQHITKQTCSVYSYDKNHPGNSLVSRLQSIRGVFTQALIGDRQYDNGTVLLSLAWHNAFSYTSGAELQALPPLLEQTVICQILIEIHGTIKQIFDLIHLIYRQFHFEINGFSMDLSEYSFIHESCMAQYGAQKLAYYWHLILASESAGCQLLLPDYELMMHSGENEVKRRLEPLLADTINPFY